MFINISSLGVTCIIKPIKEAINKARNYQPKKETVKETFAEKVKKIQNFDRKNFIFVCTDIVGSCQRWFDNPKKMESFCFWHHTRGSILVKQFNGFQSRKEGDSIFAVFEDVEDAKGFAETFMKEVREKEDSDVQIRVGVAQGSCIMMWIGGRLDFFGKGILKTTEACNNANPDEIFYDDSLSNVYT